ncbi:unnamed protein product [Effrenium voratum]|nr:unnamed protein product [Effrenium voratum]
MCEIIDLEDDDDDDDVILLEPAPAPPRAAFVLCVGVATGWKKPGGDEQLLDFLERRNVSSVLDARERPERHVSQLRRRMGAAGLVFEWCPLSGGSGPARAALAAAALRLAAAARGGGRPCVLFAGEDWRGCGVRARLAQQLCQRGVALRHGEEEELHCPVPEPAVAEALTVSTPKAPKVPKRAPKSVKRFRGRSPDTVFEALEDAATLFAESRWKGGKWESPSACQL